MAELKPGDEDCAVADDEAWEESDPRRIAAREARAKSDAGADEGDVEVMGPLVKRTIPEEVALRLVRRLVLQAKQCRERQTAVESAGAPRAVADAVGAAPESDEAVEAAVEQLMVEEEGLWQRALDVCTTVWDDAGHESWIEPLQGMAALRIRQGRPEESLVLLRRALTACKREFGGDSPQAAEAWQWVRRASTSAVAARRRTMLDKVRAEVPLPSRAVIIERDAATGEARRSDVLPHATGPVAGKRAGN